MVVKLTVCTDGRGQIKSESEMFLVNKTCWNSTLVLLLKSVAIWTKVYHLTVVTVYGHLLFLCRLTLLVRSGLDFRCRILNCFTCGTFFF